MQMNHYLAMKGFTLIELIIAAGLFSLFFLGLFSLYRGGTNMFLSGSWKLNKQKEAERFLAILKNRLEQAAIPTSIDPNQSDSSKQIASGSGSIYGLRNGVIFPDPNGPAITTPKQLLAFTICKPDLSKVNGPPGLSLPHVLWYIPRQNGLGSLQLFASRDTTSASLTCNVDEFPAQFPDGSNTNAHASDYQLGPDVFQIEIDDVSSVQIKYGNASGSINASQGGKTLGLKINFRNPNHPQTTLSQSIEARISSNVPIREDL